MKWKKEKEGHKVPSQIMNIHRIDNLEHKKNLAKNILERKNLTRAFGRRNLVSTSAEKKNVQNLIQCKKIFIHKNLTVQCI